MHIPEYLLVRGERETYEDHHNLWKKRSHSAIILVVSVIDSDLMFHLIMVAIVACLLLARYDNHRMERPLLRPWAMFTLDCY